MEILKKNISKVDISHLLVILNLISLVIIVYGLVDFIVNFYLLGFVIFMSIGFSLIIIIPAIVFYVIKILNTRKLVVYIKYKNFSLYQLLGISFAVLLVFLYSKNYILFFLIGILVVGYIIGLFIRKIDYFTKNKLIITRILIFMIILSITIPYGFLARGTLPIDPSVQVWELHQIDNPGYVLPNGLDNADVNKDGFDDYITNYEWDGYLRIAFHPGIANVHQRWKAINIGRIENAESSAFGDFDNDNNTDVVVAHGEEFGAQSGVLIIWAPNASESEDPEKWIMSSDIPDTRNKGQFHFVRGYDINEDNFTDIVVGGRGINPKAGLKWLEAPNDTLLSRNMSNWKVHDIDSAIESAHGFEFGDIDQDGDDDIVVCNSDWDTKASDQKIVWYENPGAGNLNQILEWNKTIIYQEPDFYTKEQIALHDFNNDSFPEVLISTVSQIYIFNNSDGGTTWDLVKISKPPSTIWRTRTLEIGDLNNDLKPDILGMLIHHDGYLPKHKAVVYWMNYSGPDFASGTWQTNVIKWGDGFIGLGEYNGEKWDQAQFIDMDLDGDLDIVANCEEFNSLGFVYLAVVWFENPLVSS
jgi:hypothetical protein